MSSCILLSGVLLFLSLLGFFFSLSLLFLRDFLNVELVGKLLGIDFGSENEHDSNDDNGATENDQVVGS